MANCINIDVCQTLESTSKDLPIQLKDSYYDCMLRSNIGNTITDLDDAVLLRAITITPEEMTSAIDKNLVDKNACVSRFMMFTYSIMMTTSRYPVSEEIYVMMSMNDFDRQFIEFLLKRDKSLDIFGIIVDNDVTVLTENLFQILETLGQYQPDILIKVFENHRISGISCGTCTHYTANYDLRSIALSIISYGGCDIGYRTDNNRTPLILACHKVEAEVAMALIATGRSNPGQIEDDHGSTALIYACDSQMSDVALALIATGQSNLTHVDKSGETALLYACSNQMSDVALALIATGESNPGQVSNFTNTALIDCCYNEYDQPNDIITIVNALIATGQSNPGHVNKWRETALTEACTNHMSDVALALIATGESKPGHVDNVGNTPLILCCKNNMSDIALALIATGESNPAHNDLECNTALKLARSNNMTDVVATLNSINSIE